MLHETPGSRPHPYPDLAACAKRPCCRNVFFSFFKDLKVKIKNLALTFFQAWHILHAHVKIFGLKCFPELQTLLLLSW